MASIINTNIQSLNAQRNLSATQNSLATSMQRLSSGLRINSAKDDAAGLAISDRMTTQIRGINQAARNANDGVSLAQTAEGALSSIGNNLQRIRELAVQSRNATNSDDDRASLQKEVSQLTAEIDRVASQTAFNGTKLLDGSFTEKAFQVGANQGQLISINSIVNASTDKLGEWKSVAVEASLVGGEFKAAVITPKVDAASAKLELDFNNALIDGTAAGQKKWDAFTFKIGDTDVSVAKSAVDNATAADAATALQTAIQTALTAGITAKQLPDDVTATVTAGVLTITNATDKEVAVTATGGGLNPVPTKVAAGTLAADAVDSTFEKIDFKIGDTAISVAASTSASVADRQKAVLKAINDQTATTGVTASIKDGKLSLKGAKDDITLAVGGTTDAATLAKSGLLVGTSTAGEGNKAYVKSEAKTGFTSVDVTTVEGADNAILAMDAALRAVSSGRADLGAMQNRFASTVDNLQTNSENLSASRSRILDADFAEETANLSRSQILQQAGTAMVAQANQLPQGVLALLR